MGWCSHHRRVVLRTGGDARYIYHRRVIIRPGGDDGYHRRLHFEPAVIAHHRRLE